jgi:hypothetical protein
MFRFLYSRREVRFFRWNVAIFFYSLVHIGSLVQTGTIFLALRSNCLPSNMLSSRRKSRFSISANTPLENAQRKKAGAKSTAPHSQ